MTEDHPRKVGYGRPPLHTRFKPGQSGNPNGRPKGTVSFRSDFAEELAELIAVPGDSGKLCTKRRAIVKKLISEAISGEAKDASALVSLCARLFSDSEEADPRAAEDDAFVDKLAERERQAADEDSRIASPSTEEPGHE
jgi:hypothetical protein